MKTIIGRKKEQEELRRLYQSGRAEFVVVYGRRRVGKTFLVREFFNGELDFYHTGLSPLELEGSKLQEKQLQSFYFSLKRYGSDTDHRPADWLEAFEMLIALLEKKDKNKRLIVFIDEMPWMDTPRSGFMTALEQAQIDMLIDRADRIINVCEMKFTTNEFTIDRKYDAELRRKLDIFSAQTQCRKSLHLTFVTTYGLSQNEYSGRVQWIVTMDDLF